MPKPIVGVSHLRTSRRRKASEPWARHLDALFVVTLVAGTSWLVACSGTTDPIRKVPDASSGGNTEAGSSLGTDSGSFSTGSDDAQGPSLLFDATISDASADDVSNGKPELTGTIRDFHDTHPDFEKQAGDDRGLVEKTLGPDGKPVYAGGTGTVTTHGKEAFDQWFRDTPGVNMTSTLAIPLTSADGRIFTYDNQEFFPIDNTLFGNEGQPHNYHFTYEIHAKFKYRGGEVFKFKGDDDLWVFINRTLVMDLGGVHGAEEQEVALDQVANDLKLARGSTYPLDLFFSERHTSQSTFRIDTTIVDFAPGPVQ